MAVYTPPVPPTVQPPPPPPPGSEGGGGAMTGDWGALQTLMQSLPPAKVQEVLAKVTIPQGKGYGYDRYEQIRLALKASGVDTASIPDRSAFGAGKWQNGQWVKGANPNLPPPAAPDTNPPPPGTQPPPPQGGADTNPPPPGTGTPPPPPPAPGAGSSEGGPPPPPGAGSEGPPPPPPPAPGAPPIQRPQGQGQWRGAGRAQRIAARNKNREWNQKNRMLNGQQPTPVTPNEGGQVPPVPPVPGQNRRRNPPPTPY